MKKIFIIQKFYNSLITLPAYYFVPLLLTTKFITLFILSLVGIMDISDKGDADFGEMPIGELIVLACIIAPLFETLIMHFFPIEMMLRINNRLKWLGIILSAALFGLTHRYNTSYVVFGIITGTIYAFGYIVSRDKKGWKYAYWIVVVMHTAWNTIAVISHSLT